MIVEPSYQVSRLQLLQPRRYARLKNKNSASARSGPFSQICSQLTRIAIGIPRKSVGQQVGVRAWLWDSTGVLPRYLKCLKFKGLQQAHPVDLQVGGAYKLLCGKQLLPKCNYSYIFRKFQDTLFHSWTTIKIQQWSQRSYRFHFVPCHLDGVHIPFCLHFRTVLRTVRTTSTIPCHFVPHPRAQALGFRCAQLETNIAQSNGTCMALGLLRHTGANSVQRSCNNRFCFVPMVQHGTKTVTFF